MTTLQKRVDALEQANKRGRLAVVGVGHWDWTQEQLDQAVREAEKTGDLVICVQYVKDWRVIDGESIAAT